MLIPSLTLQFLWLAFENIVIALWKASRMNNHFDTGICVLRAKRFKYALTTITMKKEDKEGRNRKPIMAC